MIVEYLNEIRFDNQEVIGDFYENIVSEVVEDKVWLLRVGMSLSSGWRGIQGFRIEF